LCSRRIVNNKGGRKKKGPLKPALLKEKELKPALLKKKKETTEPFL